jgi:hypothetical protein
VDTLYFSIDGDLLDGVLEALRTARDMAEKAGAPVESPWQFDEFPVLLRHHGWFGYGYWLTCEQFDFMITAHDVLPAVFVQIRQAYLYEMGDPMECYRRVRSWLTTWFFSEVKKITTARIDLCADVLGWPDADLDATRYTTRAVEWRTRGEGSKVTGLEWGVRGNPCFVRVYDKTLEAYVHRKTWMELLWLRAGWDPGEKEPVLDRNGEPKRKKDGSIKERWKREPERVIRLEFELRSEFLDRFAKEGQEHLAVKAPEDVLRNAGHIWEYLTGRWQTRSDRHSEYVGWLVLRQPEDSGARSRWSPPPWWEEMAANGLRQARMDRWARRQQDLIDAEALLRQAAGCIAQRAAIMGDTTLIEAAQEFAREWSRLLADKGTTFDQVVKAKAEKQGVKRRPLEKPATAAAKKEPQGGNPDVGSAGHAEAAERESGERSGDAE